ncbi:MAG TPA: peptide chain release factor N(5)-glutamine methyltransferase [Solirubrobacteraceae bacterium]|nr:peptide chain release factor N(5)-glutamine methyltransferase [Solirubrobacteraceae bacterium]
MSLAGVSARDALDSAEVALSAAGVDTPRLDAEVLLAYDLGIDRPRLAVDRERPVEGPAVRAFQDAVRRRAVEREPVAYITGMRGFRRIDVGVDPRVLIPRPETEELVEAALELPTRARVVEVGTGSGAVALALKDERGDLEVLATDVSEGALAVARANATRLGLAVRFLHADLLEGVPGADAVLSNPPYVEDGTALEPEIARHEPAGALFAGPDGLAVIRRLAAQAGRSPARLLALEVGIGQAPAVAVLVRDAGFDAVEIRRDLAGIERVVIGRR